jgi:peptide/nickel transport system permease protein
VGTYLLRRLMLAVPTIVGVSIVAFVLVAMSKGDPVLAVLGQHPTPEAYRAERLRQRLDEPLHVRYGIWAGRVLRGDLGRSSRTKRPIVEELAARWPATAELATAALIFATTVGIVAGVTSATRRRSVLDHAAMTVALVGVSLPIFWLGGILLVAVTRIDPSWPTGFRMPTTWEAMPRVTGFATIDAVLAGDWRRLLVVLQHLLLPAIALGTIPMAIISRMTRSSMLETMGQDYIRTARAKGLATRAVNYRHALRAALIPVITVVGLEFGHLLGGAIITEQIFSWPGIGNWVLTGVQLRDRDVIQAGVLVIACGFVFINLIVDVLYAVVDPRIRHA